MNKMYVFVDVEFFCVMFCLCGEEWIYVDVSFCNVMIFGLGVEYFVWVVVEVKNVGVWFYV